MLKLRLTSTLILISAVLLSACGGKEADATPTLSPEEVQTQAIGTFSAALTQTALAAPTDTPVPTLTPPPTSPPLPTSTPGTPFGQPTSSGGSTTSCYGLTYVSDVSIPDNTQMDPGEKFTKTWKVLNSGTCAWDAGFKFSFTGGDDALGGSTVTLSTAVPSGAQFDISVPMTAPSKAGTYQSNWRMSTASGQFFGNEVYVIIVVGNASPTSTTGAATATTESPTATQESSSS